MKFADLLSEFFATDLEETWERERAATPVRAFAVQFHATGCSLRVAKEVLRLPALNGFIKLFGSGTSAC